MYGLQLACCGIPFTAADKTDDAIVVQSRPCAHNITGAGGVKFAPGSGALHVHTHSACSTSSEQQNGVVQYLSVCSSTVYSRSVECKNNYRLVRVHTSVEC